MIKFPATASFGFILMMKPAANNASWAKVESYDSFEVCTAIGQMYERANFYLCIPDYHSAQDYIAEHSEEPLDN